jgi:hypothetical protein
VVTSPLKATPAAAAALALPLSLPLLLLACLVQLAVLPGVVARDAWLPLPYPVTQVYLQGPSSSWQQHHVLLHQEQQQV